MKWRRHSGNVWIRTINGTTLLVMPTLSWIFYGFPKGKQPGATWCWDVRGHRIGHGIGL